MLAEPESPASRTPTDWCRGLMFREFRNAWRQAVDNFWQEMEADGASGADQARGVYREVARARTQLDRLTAEIGDSRQRLEAEREQIRICLRRERLAAGIGDHETARIAAEYRARHEERADVLGRKLDVLEAERGLCRRDLEAMERALQERGVTEPIRPELDDLNRHPHEGEFRTLEDADRTRSAEERLEELKRRMGR